MKLKHPIILFFNAIVVVIAGYIFGAITFDDGSTSSSVASAAAQNANVAGWMMIAGAGLGVLALLWFVLVVIVRARRSQAGPPSIG